MWKDELGSTTSRQRIILSSMEQCLILQPWLRRVTYHSFANSDGMSGVTIGKNQLLFPTIVKCTRGEGNEISQWVLKDNGRVVPRRSLQPLTIAEMHCIVEKKKCNVLDPLIKRRMGTSNNPPLTPEDRDPIMEHLTNQNFIATMKLMNR